MMLPRGNGAAQILLTLLLSLSFTTTSATTDRPPIATIDSTAIAKHLELSSKQRKKLRKQAQQFRDEATGQSNGIRRLELLESAVRTDPAGVANWLALAEWRIAMGYPYQGEAALMKARTAVRFLKGDERRDAIGDYSLVRGWWHYRRGEWKKAEDWGRHAVKAEAGLDAHLIYALSRSHLFRSRKQFYEDMEPFLPYWQDWRRMGHFDWCRMMHYYFNFEEYDGPYMMDRIRKKTANKYVQGPLRWSEHAMYCEVHEDEDLALRFYGFARAAVESPEGGWLHRRERVNPVRETGMGPMPFWINSDGGYVAGSLLAYLGWVRDEMVKQHDPTQQDVLAERVLAYYERVSSRYDRHPWTALWRTEALLELDQIDDAAAEIRFAKEQFRLLELDDPALDRLHGRILLVQKKLGQAAPLLRQAVKDFPGDATCWSDLGIVEAVVGTPAYARTLFDKALALDPQLAAAWYNRGLLSRKEGDLQSAQSDLERAAGLVPDNEEVQQDLARLIQRIRSVRREG